MLENEYDAAIIGAGVVGALIARELSRYAVKTVLLERGNDVACATTKANSAIVHAGFDAKPGTLKAKMNVAGNREMGPLCDELDVPFCRNGSLVLAFTPEDLPTLEELKKRAEANGVPDVRIISTEELLRMEPHVNQDCVAALWAPTGGIVCPYQLTIAAAENAVINGVTLLRNFRVDKIHQTSFGFTIINGTPPKEQPSTVKAKLIINAAGVHTDDVARLIGDYSFRITPRRGEYLLLDSVRSGYVSSTIFQCPTEAGKGVLITPTVHGNILLGPTSAANVWSKDDNQITDAGIRDVLNAITKSVPDFRVQDIITCFAGLRAHNKGGDFILEPSKFNPMFIHAAGIESPGLTAAPAIAKYITRQARTALNDPPTKANWILGRPERIRLREMTTAQRSAAIAKNPLYGHIVCRCETVSEGEIVDAIRAPAGARDMDGVKRRTRAGMGRCQGGFCGTKVLEILARELDIAPTEVRKFGGESNILVGKTK
jgi:glycerol-3-phosphate dehydrogenase